MTQPTPPERERQVPGLELDIDEVIDTPARVATAAEATLDDQLVAILQCTEALAVYVEELHAPHGFDQFLTPAECAQVARFIDNLGDNPARGEEFFEARTGLALRQRRPETGWNAQTAHEAARQASRRSADADLPAYAQECIALLQGLVTYLDAFHGSGGFREVLTPDERRQVGTLVSRLLGG
jgi:hypothetical protein